MKFTRQALRQFLNLEGISNQKIADNLTSLGFQTNLIKDWTTLHQGLKIAQVLDFQPIKNSKNRLVQIFAGEKKHQLICGADNFDKGDYVIWAPPGSSLQSGRLKLKTKKFGNIESHGMLCSSLELELTYIKDGGIIVFQKSFDFDQIIDLKKLLENNDQNIFEIPELNDAIFETETHFGIPEARSIFGLAIYLSRKWNLKKLQTEFLFESIQKRPKTINSSQQNNHFQASFVFDNGELNGVNGNLDRLMKTLNFKSKNLKESLIFYLKYFFNISAEIKSFRQIKSLKETDNIIQTKIESYLTEFSSIYNVHYLKLEKPSVQEIPNADVYALAEFNLQKIIFPELKINYKRMSYDFHHRFSNELKCRLKNLCNLISNNIKEEDTLNFLKIAGYDVSKREKDLYIIAPNYKQVLFPADLVEDVVRFLDVNKLIEKSLSPINHSPKNIFVNWEQKIRNFFIHKGFDEVKIPLLNKNGITNPNELKQNLKQSFVSYSRILSHHMNENLFTIDDLFKNTQKIDEHNIHLTFVLHKPLVASSFVQQTPLPNFHLLLIIVRYLFSTLNIPSPLIRISSDKTKININAIERIENQSNIQQKSFKIQYKNETFGELGEIIEVKNKNCLKHYFAEINLSKLLLLTDFSKTKFVMRSSQENAFRDFSLEFEKPINEWLVTSNNEYIEQYSYIHHKLRMLDKKIIKMEILNLYKGIILTVRFWKQREPNKTLEELFRDIETNIEEHVGAKIK